MGDEEPSFGGSDCFFPILGQSAAAPQPGEGALHDPSSWQDFEALGGIGTFV